MLFPFGQYGWSAGLEARTALYAVCVINEMDPCTRIVAILSNGELWEPTDLHSGGIARTLCRPTTLKHNSWYSSSETGYTKNCKCMNSPNASTLLKKLEWTYYPFVSAR